MRPGPRPIATFWNRYYSIVICWFWKAGPEADGQCLPIAGQPHALGTYIYSPAPGPHTEQPGDADLLLPGLKKLQPCYANLLLHGLKQNSLAMQISCYTASNRTAWICKAPAPPPQIEQPGYANLQLHGLNHPLHISWFKASHSSACCSVAHAPPAATRHLLSLSPPKSTDRSLANHR